MTDERIIAYLLKELPEGDAEQFEEQCFEQESWPAQISLVEDELIEDFLRRKLTPEQHQRFEQNYLTTAARQERVGVAAALFRHVDKLNDQPSVKLVEPTWIERFHAFGSSHLLPLRVGASMAAIVIIIGALWLIRPHPFAPKPLVALTLSASGNNRAEGVQAAKVQLPLNVDELKISLTLPAGSAAAKSYRVDMENIYGEKNSLEIDKQDAQSVTVVIPAAQLARGQYVLKLFAVKDDGSEQRLGSYYFNAE
jgi:methionine-rich copper-binding protein CopC